MLCFLQGAYFDISAVQHAIVWKNCNDILKPKEVMYGFLFIVMMWKVGSDFDSFDEPKRNCGYLHILNPCLFCKVIFMQGRLQPKDEWLDWMHVVTADHDFPLKISSTQQIKSCT